jgi:GNAT superfamily N-acetyltransferase
MARQSVNLDRILRKVRNGIYMQRLLENLARLGIEITPYYIVREQANAAHPPVASAPMPGLDAGWLESKELGEVLHLEGKGIMLDELQKRAADGHRCFVAKLEARVIAKMWCNLREFHSPPCQFDLQDDEAYLYAAHTEPGHQGKGIAPFLRENCYKALANEGITNFYSYTEYFNIPAKKFKKKLGARNLALCLYVSLFEQISWNWTLKKYEEKVVS